MLYLITGGSGSGKSAYAEKLAVSCFQKTGEAGGLYYIATMYPYDAECENRIERHRAMRKDKGFTTVECYSHIGQLQAGGGDVLLLECMSNLLANEMYTEQGQLGSSGDSAFLQLEKAILAPLRRLKEQAGSVIVVTNEVFSDGMSYAEETERYVRLLGKINQELAKEAEAVVEVVCSIPVFRKGELLC